MSYRHNKSPRKRVEYRYPNRGTKLPLENAPDRDDVVLMHESDGRQSLDLHKTRTEGQVTLKLPSPRSPSDLSAPMVMAATQGDCPRMQDILCRLSCCERHSRVGYNVGCRGNYAHHVPGIHRTIWINPRNPLQGTSRASLAISRHPGFQ